ncbi:MAG TPA: serine hydrolase [Chloroflexota bacterium]|nr:serine hydrolase [Chloroflexota bacterium]
MKFRRTRLSTVGLAGAVAATFGTVRSAEAAGGAAPPDPVADRSGRMARLRHAYERETARAGGRWCSYVTVVDGTGVMRPVIEQRADDVLNGYSVQKLAVALAVLDKVDRNQLRLEDRLDLTADIIATGSGLYHLQTVYGDQLTLANLMTAMLLVSDNTAVRMFGRVVPGPELNQILARKGFTHTRVEPLPENPHRFYLGTTTPREMHRLLLGLADKTLTSPRGADLVLGILRWVNGYHDGVRREMSSEERSRIATKYGAYEDARHEAGILFDADGAPLLIYAYFATGLREAANYGATNPGVQAHAALGRAMLDAVYDATNVVPQARHQGKRFTPADGR